VFDLSEPQSLAGIDKRIEHFRDYSKPDSVLFIVGNKRDLVVGSKTANHLQHE
jgi:hypothetical protein